MFLNMQLFMLLSTLPREILMAELVLSVLFKSQKVRFSIFHLILSSLIQIPYNPERWMIVSSMLSPTRLMFLDGGLEI